MKSPPMRSRRREAGLTLMEVLVAVALLSLLSAGILVALRVGSAAWQSANTNLTLDRRIATANTILNSALEGIFPAMAEFNDPATRSQTTAVLFQGEPQSMRFVTSYSLESGPRSGLRLVELQVVDGPKGRRVLLNEQIYDGPRAAGRVVTGVARTRSVAGMRLLFAPILTQPNSFVIADELESCVFTYRTPPQFDRPDRWDPAWEDPYSLPSAVSIQITPRQNSARLRPVPVTVPIRSTFFSL